MIRPWFSESEYRATVNRAIPASLPKPTDAEFDATTRALVQAGLVEPEVRNGIRGFAVTAEGLCISGIVSGH